MQGSLAAKCLGGRSRGWYDKSTRYWEQQSADDVTVMGGLDVGEPDINGSLQFLRKVSRAAKPASCQIGASPCNAYWCIRHGIAQHHGCAPYKLHCHASSLADCKPIPDIGCCGQELVKIVVCLL
jgi:hypothetical protein